LIKTLFYILLFFYTVAAKVYSQDDMFEFPDPDVDSLSSPMDTTYNRIAPQSIIDMIKPGKPPNVTFQLSFNYNIGHLGLADNENAFFRKDDFIGGKSFGTRYGYGIAFTGKFILHDEGNIRANVTAGYNKFLSNFVIEESPEGKVLYNVYSVSAGIENNFSPTKRLKPFFGVDVVFNSISGSAVLATDTGNFDLNIRGSIRYGIALNFGFEYAFNDKVGFNFGYKITHANLVGRQVKNPPGRNETYINDETAVPDENGDVFPFTGSKKFVYSTFYTGFNFYLGMRNKK
jgi:hypothetical protein